MYHQNFEVIKKGTICKRDDKKQCIQWDKEIKDTNI